MKGRVSLAVVQLAAFIECEPRAAPDVGHDDLNFTIVFFLGVTMILSVYRHRTSQRETKGMFRRSRNVPLGSCCISPLGRPSCLPEDSNHREEKGAIRRSRMAPLSRSQCVTC